MCQNYLNSEILMMATYFEETAVSNKMPDGQMQLSYSKIQHQQTSASLSTLNNM
jgi:hypothetical protein